MQQEAIATGASLSSQWKDRLSGIVTFIKSRDFIVFFDGGHTMNAFTVHEVAMLVQRWQELECHRIILDLQG